jgi:hypothetical protein
MTIKYDGYSTEDIYKIAKASASNVKNATRREVFLQAIEENKNNSSALISWCREHRVQSDLINSLIATNVIHAPVKAERKKPKRAATTNLQTIIWPKMNRIAKELSAQYPDFATIAHLETVKNKSVKKTEFIRLCELHNITFDNPTIQKVLSTKTAAKAKVTTEKFATISDLGPVVAAKMKCLNFDDGTIEALGNHFTRVKATNDAFADLNNDQKDLVRKMFAKIEPTLAGAIAAGKQKKADKNSKKQAKRNPNSFDECSRELLISMLPILWGDDDAAKVTITTLKKKTASDLRNTVTQQAAARHITINDPTIKAKIFAHFAKKDDLRRLKKGYKEGIIKAPVVTKKSRSKKSA